MEHVWKQWGWALLLIAVRLGPMTICLPTSLFRGLPRGARLIFVLLLSLALTPVLTESGRLDWNASTDLIAMVSRELLLGISLAVGFVLMFAGLTIAGQLLSPLTGITWADAADPMGGNASGLVIERFFSFWAVVLFWVTNGHRHVLTALLDSFERTPLGSVWSGHSMPHQVAALLMHSTQLGIQIAAPVAFCLMGATLAVALLGRSLSFWGVSGMGTAVSWLVLLLATCIFLPSLSEIYRQQLLSGLTLIEGLVRPMSVQGGT